MTIPTGPYGTLKNGIRYDGTPSLNLLRTQATNPSCPVLDDPEAASSTVVPLAWMPLQVPEETVAA
jgi:hypothetical protein